MANIEYGEKLNIELAKSIFKKVDENEFFKNDYKFLFRYNLICASIERIETCANYINNHMFYPNSEEEFICLFMFVGMLYDCIIKLTNEFRVDIKFNKENFKDLYENNYLNILNEDDINDKVIFEYLRSLIFAHPTDTNRVSFLKRRKEQHVSPWVIVNNRGLYKEGIIGVRIYSDKQKQIIDLLYSFEEIINFTRFIYSYVSEILKSIDKILREENDRLMLKKIKRGNALIEIFKDAKNILENRYQDTYIIDDFIDIASIKSKDKVNVNAIEKIQKEMFENIKMFCDAIDENDNDKLDEYIKKFFPLFIDYGYEMGFYHREKIFMYLNEDSSAYNLDFAKECLKTFYDNYASKYVFIDIEKDDFNDIKNTFIYC